MASLREPPLSVLKTKPPEAIGVWQIMRLADVKKFWIIKARQIISSQTLHLVNADWTNPYSAGT